MKIDYDHTIVLGSRNRFIFDLFEVNFGWVLSKKKDVSPEDLKISKDILEEYLELKDHHTIKFEDL